MELRQLRYFLTVLRLGSINQAAAVLNMTQPSLSHSIKALERSVGAELIIRGGGGVRATVIGEQFSTYANTIVREAEKAKAVVDAFRGAGDGHISMGVLSTFSGYLVPRVLSEFCATARSPDVDVFVHTATVDEVMRRILRADWDLALTLAGHASRYPPEIGSKDLGIAVSSVYCGAAHPLAARRNLTLLDMEPYRWIASTLGLTDALLASGFGEEQSTSKVCLRTDSMTLISSLLSEFPFLCMAPDLAVADQVKRGVLVRLDQNDLQSSARLVVLHSNLSDRTPAMRSMISIIADHVRSLASDELVTAPCPAAE